MPPNDIPTPRRSAQVAGPLSIAAATATILLAGLAIGILATTERRVRIAVERQQVLDAALRDSAACANAFDAQVGAWKSLLLAELLADEHAVTRAKSALATVASDMNDHLSQLADAGRAAGLPIDRVDHAVRAATEASDAMVEAIADLRVADANAAAAAEHRTSSPIQQARFELSNLAEQWQRTASGRRVDEFSQAAVTARRTKAWVEILSLVAVGLVIAVGALAVRRRKADVCF